MKDYSKRETYAKKHKIYDLILDIHKFKANKEVIETKKEIKKCPIYSPGQECVGTKCLWYDKINSECWVLNPKTYPMTGISNKH